MRTVSAGRLGRIRPAGHSLAGRRSSREEACRTPAGRRTTAAGRTPAADSRTPAAADRTPFADHTQVAGRNPAAVGSPVAAAGTRAPRPNLPLGNADTAARPLLAGRSQPLPVHLNRKSGPRRRQWYAPQPKGRVRLRKTRG